MELRVILNWAKTTYEGEGKEETNWLRAKEMSLTKALKEIHGALKSKYEISYIQNDKIVLLKYDKEDGLFSLIVEGKEDEINHIMQDETIWQSLL